MNKTLALLAAVFAGWSLILPFPEVGGAPPDEVVGRDDRIENETQPTALPGAPVDPRPVATKAAFRVAPQLPVPLPPVSRWNLENVRENTLFNHFLRGLRIGLAGILMIGVPLLLLLVLYRRIRAAIIANHQPASEPRRPEHVGAGRPSWRGLLVSAGVCLALCGAGAATTYSPSGPRDSIGGGLLIFCGYVSLIAGILYTFNRAVTTDASDPVVPGVTEARRFSGTTPSLFLILAGAIGLFVLVGRLIRHDGLLATLLAVMVVLIGSMLGIMVNWSKGRRSVPASIVGGAAGCAVTLGGCLFFSALLISPEQGSSVMGHQAVDPFLGLVCGALSGGMFGSVVGLLGGRLDWFLRKWRTQR